MKVPVLIRVMRFIFVHFLLMVSMVLAGCRSGKEPKVGEVPAKFGGKTPGASKESKKPAQSAKAKAPAKPVTPQDQPVVRVETAGGRVAWVNYSLKFVVLDFTLKQVPELGSRMFLYRSGRKVGEVKITGPVRENNIAADLIAGDAEVGDETRPE